MHWVSPPPCSPTAIIFPLGCIGENTNWADIRKSACLVGGKVSWESPYRAVLSDVTVLGAGRQKQLTGWNKLADLTNVSSTSIATINQGIVTAVPTGESNNPGTISWSSGWYAAKFSF